MTDWNHDQPLDTDQTAWWHRTICKVTEHLWLSGDLHEEQDRALAQLRDWQSEGVTHILDCRVEYSDEDLVREHAPELIYFHLGVDDDGVAQESTWFDEGVTWAQDALDSADNNVLVHCHMGVNRAPSMVLAILLSTGWGVQAALDRIREARPIAAVLYAPDAVEWHQERHPELDSEVKQQERELADRWVAEHLDEAIAVVERLRRVAGQGSGWQLIDRDEVIQEIHRAASIAVSDAERILDALEDGITTIWEDGDAVEYPGIGPIDALDHDASDGYQTARTLTMLDLAPDVSKLTGIDEPVVTRAIIDLVGLIEAAAEHGDVIHLPVLGQWGPDEAMDEIEAEYTAEAIERLRTSSRQTWLVQCNPAKFDVLTAIDEEGLPTNWSVNRYQDRIQPGDRVVFWLTGRKAGVYAIGEVSSTPYESRVNDVYAADPNPSWDTYVELDLFLDLFDRPVPRTELKDDPRFASQSIITIPRAANPHELDDAAFQAILERVT